MTNNVKILIPSLVVIISILVLSIPDAKAAGVAFQSGDIFTAVGGGQVRHYSSSGVLLDTLDTTTGSTYTTGMCFDKSGDLYSTNFDGSSMSKFDNHGNLLVAHWGGPFSIHPESCVLDKTGNVYVGEVDGNNDILKFDQAGNLLATYNVGTQSRGTDWIDLAADQCTMYYTSEGSSVKRFDVCTNTQLPDFTTSLSGPAYALRILNNTNHDILVASTNQLYLLDGTTGSILHTYPNPSPGDIAFAMNIDPDGKTFWSAGYSTGKIFHIDITTGTLLSQFSSVPISSLAGVAVFGEPTVGCAPNCPQSIHVDTKLSSTSIPLGGTFTDNATLTGATSNAGGTITYKVYDSSAACTGTPLFTSTTAVVNAKATPSSPFKPTVASIYNVQAQYSGDSNNLGAESECDSETVTVTGATKVTVTTNLSTSSVVLGGSITDSATLTGVTSNAGGQVTYKIYNSTIFSPANLVFTSKVKVTNGIVPNSAPFTPTKVGLYSAVAIYSGDIHNKGASSKCGSELFEVVAKGSLRTILHPPIG